MTFNDLYAPKTTPIGGGAIQSQAAPISKPDKPADQPAKEPAHQPAPPVEKPAIVEPARSKP